MRQASHQNRCFHVVSDSDCGEGAEGHLRVQIDADGDLIELPGMVTRLLQTLLEHMAAGRGISIMPLGAELTTQQASDLLGVSRPFLIKLLEEGRIPPQGRPTPACPGCRLAGLSQAEPGSPLRSSGRTDLNWPGTG